ncbi:MAG: hypothetical protein II345_03240 [Alistipes sp.]|nr:hypothetical protein [Alistipes sp.]
MKKALNVLLGVLMVVTVGLTAYAIAAGGSDAAISLNLIWGYCLMIGAVVAAVGGAIYSTLKSPAGAKMSILSVVLILAIVGVAYFISAGHTVQIVDLQNNGYFPHVDTVITETSILVTYVAFAASIVTALVTEIWAAFK